MPRSRRIPPIALRRQAPQSDYLRDQLGTARISPDVQITRLDATGAGVQLITGASATITANQAVTELTIALAHVLAGEAVTINGLTFTAHATTTTPANREFDISGADTADELASLINDETYGVPGATAVNAAGTLTLTVDDPSATTITASSSDAMFTIATVKAQAYVEADHFASASGR